jgi:RuvA, C-terminal domain
MFRVYYYGLHKWENYLLDIDQDIQNAGRDVARETSGLHDTVRSGFEGLRSGIECLQSGIEDLRAEFQWGFSLLADRLDTQISIMTGIAKKLDAINAALDAPLDKQARELFKIGLVRLQDGLDDKALESFLQSEQKNDVDFVLQLYIGKLLLYGTGIKNLQKAKEHLLLAARYAEAKRGRIDCWNQFAAEAYFHAAVAVYLEGEDALGDGKHQDLSALLEMAIGFLSKAESLWPEFLEICYTRAKCCALLGKQDDVRRCFEFLSDRDRRYFLKADEDKDFDGVRELLKELANHVIANPGLMAQKIIERVEMALEAYSWANRGANQVQATEEGKSERQAEGSKTPLSTLIDWASEVHYSADGRQNGAGCTQEGIEDVKRRIEEAEASVSTLNSDLVGLNSALDADIKLLTELANARLNKRLSAAKATLEKNNYVRDAQEAKVKAERIRMGEQSGWGTGVLYAIVSLFAFAVVAAALMNLVFRGSGFSMAIANDITFCGVIIVLIGGFIGNASETRQKRAPIRESIANSTALIAECDSMRPRQEIEVSSVSKDLEDFLAWRQRNQQCQTSRVLAPMAASVQGPAVDDALAALTNLGYQRAAAVKAIEQAVATNRALAADFDGLFRGALKVIR